jgi:hypothetical protein
MRHELLGKFGIESEATEMMRYVAKRGKLGTGPVTRICIFTPAMLTAAELAACTYDKLMALDKGLLFTGHILERIEFSSADSVILYDRRT